MIYLILSDIHANLEALDAVLESVRNRQFQAIVSLGDVVGYGPDPEACVQRLQELQESENLVCVRGNHDAIVTGAASDERCSVVAKRSWGVTLHQLSHESLRFLRGQQVGPVVLGNEGHEITVCHGSPIEEDRYLKNTVGVSRSLPQGFDAAKDRRVFFFGHTHTASWFSVEPTGFVAGGSLMDREISWRLDEDRTWLCNPGSVGQPRDGDPRASYVIYDTRSRRLEWHRVRYDTEKTRLKLRESSLPSEMGRRLGRLLEKGF